MNAGDITDFHRFLLEQVGTQLRTDVVARPAHGLKKEPLAVALIVVLTGRSAATLFTNVLRIWLEERSKRHEQDLEHEEHLVSLYLEKDGKLDPVTLDFVEGSFEDED
ncbi:MAG: hypothetical protein M3083_00330 [Actinomycetota bacterium]|nr:hypothetical protein [Actinomycetota bacterium]